MITLIASVATAILTSIVTSLIAHRLQIAKIRAEFQKDQWASVHLRKWEIYLDFIDQMKEIFQEVQVKMATGANPMMSPDSMAKAFFRFNTITSKLWLIGSPDVVNEYARFRYYCANDQSTENYGDNVLKRFGELILVIRKDLGLDNSGLDYAAVLRSYLPHKDELHNRIQ